MFNDSIRHRHGTAQIIGCEPRPPTKRSETKVIAETDVSRNDRAQSAKLRDVSLDHGLGVETFDATVRVLQFGRTVPLDGKVVARNFLQDGLQLARELRPRNRVGFYQDRLVREKHAARSRC